MGPVPGVEGLFVCAGHHRNGILLAPVTANKIADYLLKGSLDTLLEPFLLDRFTVDRAKGVAAAE